MCSMLNKRIYLVLGKDNDLGNKLHSHYIYQSDRQTQIRIKHNINDILLDFEPRKIESLAYNDTTRNLLIELITLQNEANWEKIVVKILKALEQILKREIVEMKTIKKPSISHLKNKLTSLPFYDDSVLLTVEEKRGLIEVDLLIRTLSPEYNGKFESWRDTQFRFKLNYLKNLFIWDYLNVHAPFRGNRIGTTNVLFIEDIASNLGFTRFSVEYPNRKYWIEKLNYDIPYCYRIGSGRYQYTLEGYKTHSC